MKVIPIMNQGKYISNTLCLSLASNRVPANTIFVEQNSPEPKVQVLIPVYEPLEVTKCKKCGKIITKLITNQPFKWNEPL